MSTVFEISTKNYTNDSMLVKKAMSHMETLTGNYNGYMFSEPSSKFGWTFFKMSLRPEIEDSLRKEFSDMLSKYRWGNQDDRFANFLTDYFKAKGCTIKLKKLG